jgi:hypothetical protein
VQQGKKTVFDISHASKQPKKALPNQIGISFPSFRYAREVVSIFCFNLLKIWFPTPQKRSVLFSSGGRSKINPTHMATREPAQQVKTWLNAK